MKSMNKNLMIVLFALTVVSAQAEVAATSKFGAAKETCAKFVQGLLGSTKNGFKAVGTSVTSVNSSVDTAITSKVAWFKNHNTTLQASKAVVAAAVVATTCYMLKKAYDAVKAYRAKKA